MGLERTLRRAKYSAAASTARTISRTRTAGRENCEAGKATVVSDIRNLERVGSKVATLHLMPAAGKLQRSMAVGGATAWTTG